MAQNAKNMTAVEIMQELANEPRDFEERLAISLIIRTLQKIEGFSPELNGRLFSLRNYPDNILGHGYVEIPELEVSGVEIIFGVLINAMEKMKKHELHPVDALSEAIREFNPEIDEERALQIILGMQECGTLAEFVYWCPVNS